MRRGRRMQVASPTPMCDASPRTNAPTDTQALHGETLIAYEEKDGWCWVQLDRDRYVGYISRGGPRPTDRQIRTSRVRAPHHDLFGAGHQIAAPRRAAVWRGSPHRRRRGRILQTGIGGYIFSRHLAPNNPPLERFCRAGRNVSAHALSVGRQDRRRASTARGSCRWRWRRRRRRAARHRHDGVDARPPGRNRSRLRGLRRGDLVFWRGHVGIMRSEQNCCCTPTPIHDGAERTADHRVATASARTPLRRSPRCGACSKMVFVERGIAINGPRVSSATQAAPAGL